MAAELAKYQTAMAGADKAAAAGKAAAGAGAGAGGKGVTGRVTQPGAGGGKSSAGAYTRSP